MSNGDAATRAGVGRTVGTSCTPGAPGISSSRLGWRTWMCAALAVLLVSTANAAKVPDRVPRDSLVRVELDEGENCFVLSSDFSTVDLAKTKDGVVFTGKPGRYAVVVSSNGDLDQPRFVEIFDGQPTPPVPPGPGPVVPPVPDADKAPLPGLAGLKVLLIYESGDLPPKVPAAQYNIKVDPQVTGWLTANTTPENGWAGWRVGDPDAGVTQGAMHWEKMLSLPRSSTPWVIINDGTNNRGFSGPMPADSEKMLELLKRFK